MDKRPNFLMQLIYDLFMGLIGAKEIDDDGFVIRLYQGGNDHERRNEE